MRKLLLACLVIALPSQAQAQEAPDRFLFEAGIVGGNSIACPGRYVGISGRVAGPVSLYGMVENYRCADIAGSANRIGASALLGRSGWVVRPALRAGIEYDADRRCEPHLRTALRGARHPPRRRRVRRYKNRALPDGRLHFVLSPDGVPRGEGFGARVQASPGTRLDGLPARDRWCGSARSRPSD